MVPRTIRRPIDDRECVSDTTPIERRSFAAFDPERVRVYDIVSGASIVPLSAVVFAAVYAGTRLKWLNVHGRQFAPPDAGRLPTSAAKGFAPAAVGQDDHLFALSRPLQARTPRAVVTRRRPAVAARGDRHDSGRGSR
jgi:hypothetical protein